MPVYKIFAEKDATIYSEFNTMNTGLDPILELSKQPSSLFGEESTAARILIKFSDEDIRNVYNLMTEDNRIFLRLFLADAANLPADYTVEVFPCSESWDMGTGRYLNVPKTIDGVSWTYRNANNTDTWQTSSFNTGISASFSDNNAGGGTWYNDLSITQSFSVYSRKDIYVDVTSIIYVIVEGSITNNGFIIKLKSIEFDENYQFKLAYFSRDTNTIYPPVLEFKWSDSVYDTGSAPGTEIDNQDFRISIANNKGEFYDSEKYRFRLNVRDQYPARVFSTSSLYTVQKYLPQSSSYAIKDTKSDLMVVDFDNDYTTINLDDKGNYFDVYMNGLEPERYYKILIKTIVDGSIRIFDDQYFFKVKEDSNFSPALINILA